MKCERIIEPCHHRPFEWAQIYVIIAQNFCSLYSTRYMLSSLLWRVQCKYLLWRVHCKYLISQWWSNGTINNYFLFLTLTLILWWCNEFAFMMMQIHCIHMLLAFTNRHCTWFHCNQQTGKANIQAWRHTHATSIHKWVHDEAISLHKHHVQNTNIYIAQAWRHTHAISSNRQGRS